MPRKIGSLVGVGLLLSVFLLSLAAAQQQDRPAQEETTTQESGQSSQPAAQQQPRQPEQTPGAPVDDPAALLGVMVSTEFILGSNIQDTNGEDLGQITQLIINPDTGLVSYAVVSGGGFMGIGEKSIVIPWRAIKLVRDKSNIILNVSKTVIEEAPEYPHEGASAEQSQ